MKRLFFLSGLLLTQTLFASHLTIYDSGLALIEEESTFHFTPQTDKLLYKDIPKTILNNSISVVLPPKMELLQQNLQRENLTPYNIAKHFIGKDIYINNSKYKLLTLNNTDAYVRDTKLRVKRVNLETLSYATMPQDLHTDNALLLYIDKSYKTDAKVKLRYLAKNISFATDYILELTQKNASLSAWVTISNESNKDFLQSSLSLLAGDIQRSSNDRTSTRVLYKTLSSDRAAKLSNTVEHTNLQNYHLYNIPKRVDIKSGEKSRLKLFEKKAISYKTTYSVQADNPLYLMGQRSKQIQQNISFKLPKHALPKGLVRIYKTDKQRGVLIGENYIQNTPKDTTLEIELGKDFDTKLTQKLLKRADTKTTFHATIEYILTNHSDKEKKINLLVPFIPKEGSKIITSELYRFTKGNLATFTIRLPANSTKSLQVEFISKRR